MRSLFQNWLYIGGLALVSSGCVFEYGTKGEDLSGIPSRSSSAQDGSCAESFRFREVGSKTSFDAFGRNSNHSLEAVPGINMYWFAYSVFFPNSETYQEEIVNAGKALPETSLGGRSACFRGRDCIPFLGFGNKEYPTRPIEWVTPNSAEAKYLDPTDTIMGISFNGKARAYPRNYGWWHEIFNDELEGQKYSVSLCPLVGASLAVDARETGFLVSGNLFNANLIMEDFNSGRLWPQLFLGSAIDKEWLKQLPLYETTWRKWKNLFPETEVMSESTGIKNSYARNYRVYPYGSFQTDSSLFIPEAEFKPSLDKRHPPKTYVHVLANRAAGVSKGFVSDTVYRKNGKKDCIVVNEEFNGKPIVYIYASPAEKGLPPEISAVFISDVRNGKAILYEIVTD